jgi:hypothetical protein
MDEIVEAELTHTLIIRVVGDLAMQVKACYYSKPTDAEIEAKLNWVTNAYMESFEPDTPIIAYCVFPYIEDQDGDNSSPSKYDCETQGHDVDGCLHPIHGTKKYRAEQYVKEPVTYASGGVVTSEVLS